jgi:hypothetical protein
VHVILFLKCADTVPDSAGYQLIFTGYFLRVFLISFEFLGKLQDSNSAYIPPSHLNNLPALTEAVGHFSTYKCSPILLGDLSVDLTNPTSKRCAEVSTTLGAYGMEDLLLHFKQ